MSAKLNSMTLLVLLLLTITFTSCKENNDYIYPSVKLDFLTANTDALGNISSIVNNEGSVLSVINDRTKTKLKANSQQRIISNYEEHAEGVEIYALAQIIGAKPLKLDDKELENGIKTDPIEVISISKGYGFLNLVLSVKMQNQKHYLHSVEESITYDDNHEKRVNLLLYHDANNDAMSFGNRIYMSIDVSSYLSEDTDKVKIILSYHDLNGKLTECQPILF